MPVSNMDDIADFESEDVTLPTHTSPVNIFLNTRAIDVPNKLNLLATSFRDFNVNVKNAWESYIDAQAGRMATYLNSAMGDVVGFVNDTLVVAQNQFISDGETALSDMNDGLISFKNSVLAEVGGYVNATAYSVENSNKFEFSGETSADTYDSRGRLTSITQGVKTLSNITYGNMGRIVSYTETITVDSASYTKNYTIEYRRGLVPKVTEA